MNLTPDDIRSLLPGVIAWQAVGSRETVNPPPVDSDEDILCLIPSLKQLEIQYAMGAALGGYDLDGSDVTPWDEEGNDAEWHFSSYTDSISGVNLIVTDKPEFYDKFVLATHVAKSLNVTPKEKRLVLFQAILYGNAV